MTSLGNHSRLVMRLNQSNAIDILCVIVLVAYFLHFALPAVGGGFPGHDMMNMYTYWLPGMLKSFQANICFWTSFYRPGGALYYLPLYHFFGLNPQPYRIVQISILATSIPIVYYLARLLGSSRSVAFLGVLAFLITRNWLMWCSPAHLRRLMRLLLLFRVGFLRSYS
jgi:hypothetical protein